MATKQERENKLFLSYQEKYGKNDFPGALSVLEKLLEMTDIKSFVSSLIVDVYVQMGMSDEAYVAAKKGVMYQNVPSKLYKQYAELIVARAANVDDLSIALDAIEKAIQIYNNDSINEDVAERFNDTETFKYWFDDKTRTRTDMASLRSDIKSLTYSLNIYNNVQKIEENIAGEKQKTIELMALFTAIIALILSNIQVLSQKRELIEVLVVNLSLIISITWILWLVRRIGNGYSLIPRPKRSLGQIMGGVVGALLVLLLIGLIAMGIIYVYSWVIVQLKG